MCGPLGNRGIDVGYLHARGFALDLSTSPAESFDVSFVYPTRPMEGGAVTARHDVPWVNTREDVLTSRDKVDAIAALGRAGLPVSWSVCVSNPSDEPDPSDAAGLVGLDYPVVVKLNSTTRGVGIVKVHDPDSLSGHAGVLGPVHDFRATGDRSFPIQEWLPEVRDYWAMVFDGEVIGAVERRLPNDARDGRRWKHNVHRGAEAVGVTLPKSHRELVEPAADELGIRYLGVDLLEPDGRVVVSETNARPTTDDDAKYDDGFFDRLAAPVGRVTKES